MRMRMRWSESLRTMMMVILETMIMSQSEELMEDRDEGDVLEPVSEEDGGSSGDKLAGGESSEKSEVEST